ncbi:hypothetical protein Acsp04_62830 [Actinomadura sp. NBRC 104425]|nr:hypothetical protein Acsp04_62830 [Actinomadura sp. NBRC 104425]
MPEQERDWFKDPPARRVGALALISRGDGGEFLVNRRKRPSPARVKFPPGSKRVSAFSVSTRPAVWAA